MVKDQTAFELWLRQGLTEAYGAALREPVPDELLRLLDDKLRQE